MVLTRAPRFLDKARLFPGAAFLLGFDTAVRLVDAKYYAPVPGGSPADAVVAALLPLAAGGTRFVVAGRWDASSRRFLTLADALPGVPPLLRPMFIELPEAAFRLDVSSTQLRAAAGAGT